MPTSMKDGPVFFYDLGSIRNPDAWAEANKRAHNREKRLAFRQMLNKQLAHNPHLAQLSDDQLVFAVAMGGKLELLKPDSIVDKDKIKVGEDTLIADKVHNRVLIERHEGESTQLLQRKGNTWSPLRVLAKKADKIAKPAKAKKEAKSAKEATE